MRNQINDFAPSCSIPHCTNRVRYHRLSTRQDGTSGVRWKVVCEYHRGAGKEETDRWKMSQGCANQKHKHYSFDCYTSKIIMADQLDVNHINGDHRNNSVDNIEILCKNCHVIVTKLKGHHKIRYYNIVDLSPDLFETL